MLDPVLTSPNVKLFADSNDTVTYKRDAGNYITQVFGEQMPAIATGFFNVHMTKGIIIQPHWHTNANELVFVISGEVLTSIFNPFTQRLMTYKLKPGQVAMLPKGWFHWILTLSDRAHILTIFDQPTPDIVYGADFLRHIPREILNIAYCINEEEYAEAVAPLKETVILGPPPGCSKRDEQGSALESIQEQAFGQAPFNHFPPPPSFYGYPPPAAFPFYTQQTRPPQYSPIASSAAYPPSYPPPYTPVYPPPYPAPYSASYPQQNAYQPFSAPSRQQPHIPPFTPSSFQPSFTPQLTTQLAGAFSPPLSQPEPFRQLQYLFNPNNISSGTDVGVGPGPEKTKMQSEHSVKEG